LKQLPGVVNQNRVYFNPNYREAWFEALAHLMYIITLFAILLPAAALVREKEKGTIEQLVVTPLSLFQIIFPKILSMSIVVLAGCFFSLTVVLKGLLDLPVKGSLLLFLFVSGIYVFTTAGLAVMIASIARNLAQAGMMTLLIISPILLLSGLWTPPEAMPGWLRFISMFFPLRYYIIATFGILLKGAGIKILWSSILGLALLGTLLLLVSMIRFRRLYTASM
jgi:ABC-2 type transport system permease protein